MDPFLKMDIFFVVATVGVAVLALLALIIGIQVVRILRRVERIAAVVEEEAVELRGDIAAVRAKVKVEGMKAALALAEWLPFNPFGTRRKKRRSSSE